MPASRERPAELVAEVAAAHRVLERHLDGLTDDDVRAASLLPGWTRAHVLAHVRNNAEAFRRIAEYAERGEQVDMYDGGQAGRDAAIEAGARSDAATLTSEVGKANAALEATWAGLDDAAWRQLTRFRQAPLAMTLHGRWRETLIHLVDLDLAYRPDQWPEQFTAHAVEFLLVRLPDGFRVHATDTGQTWGEGAELLTGRAYELATWLAGRDVPGVQLPAARTLPQLGPWPHPGQAPQPRAGS